jgi:hypothetical protein
MNDTLAFRNALASAPLPPLQEGVKLTEVGFHLRCWTDRFESINSFCFQVKIPRAPVKGLEESNSGEIAAEWQIKEGTAADAPVVVSQTSTVPKATKH